MQRLFDHDVATPARPKAEPAHKRREPEVHELGSGAPQAIWALLLDRGADPLALATLLRDGVPASERRRAYLEMVRDLGPALASRVWTEAFVARGLKRAALPSDARDVAEAALGESLDGVQLVSGPAVEALASRLGTPAFTVGNEVFVGPGGGDASVLVHEAIHAAQQRGAATGGKPAAPSEAAERDVHRVLRRVGPIGPGSRFARDRARTAMAVRAALGRAPRVAPRPVQLAAYEATHGIVDAVQSEAKKLVEALIKLLDGNAGKAELQKVLGAAADSFAERIRRTALHELAGRKTADGKDVRALLAQKLGGIDPSTGQRAGRPLPAGVRHELESRLGVGLGDVRVHDDDAAAAEAERLGAVAFTQGQDIYFGGGKLDASSTEGRRLLAHEVAHVAQQAFDLRDGLSPGSVSSPATATASVSAPGSAVEREADRAADAFVAAGPYTPFPIRERAPAGTISRKGAGDGGGGGKFAVHLYTYNLDTDPASGVDTGDGFKKLTLPQTKFGPVSLDEFKVQVDGDKVSRGTLKAHLDDGKFKGSATTLNVDSQGNVSGQLDLGLNVPGAFVKNVKVTVNNDGLSAKANISGSDFVGKELPIKAAGDMAVQVQNSAAGLDVQMIGASTVELDSGFANGQGTMTAAIGPGTIDATVDAKFSVPGLGSEITAAIKWDGKKVDIAATAALAVTIPGLAGTAKVTYKNGKLDVDIPDLKFVADALSALKFAKQQIEAGKLKGKINVSGNVAFESAGAQVTLSGGSTLAIDGSEIAGKAAGTFGLGPKGATVVEGAFDVGMADGGFDGTLTLNKANVSFLQANNVSVTVKGIGKPKPTIKASGDIAVNIGDIVKGSIKGLSYDGGAPTGDVTLDVKIPQVTVPQLTFTLGSGWSIKNATKQLKAAIDFADGVLGNLGALDLELGLSDGGTLPKLTSMLGDFVVKAKSVSVPGFEGLGTLDDFNLKIPGKGGQYQFGQSSGNANLTLKLGSKPTKVAIAIHEGKVSAKVKSEVDIKELAPALSGKLKIGVDTSAAEKLSIEATDVHAADPELAKQLKIAKAAYKNGKLTADASVAGQLSYGGMTLNVAESNLHVDTGQSPGFSGNAKFSVAGEGAKADITATVNKEGKLDIAGESDIDLAQLTGGAATGKVHAAGGSVGGLKKFSVSGAKITKKPFDAVTIKSIGYDKGSDHLDVDLEVKADSLQLPGMKLDKLDGGVRFVKNGGTVGFDGHVKSPGVSFDAGGTVVGQGALDVTYKNGVATGNAELKTLALKFGSFSATVKDFKVDISDGVPKAAPGTEPSIGIKQEGLFDVLLKAKLGAAGIENFDVHGTIQQTPLTKQATATANWKPGKGTTFKVEGELSDLGGLIDADKKFHVGYDGTQIDAGIEKFTVQKGDLKDWSLGGSVKGKDIDVAIESPDAGAKWTFGNIELSLEGKNKLSYTSGGGVAGAVKAKVAIGDKSVGVGATFADSKIKSITVEANNLDIHEIIPPLAGKFSVSYDSEKKDLKSKGSVGPSDPELAKALHVDYTYENKTFNGTFTSEMNAPFNVGPLSGHVKKCEIKAVLGPQQKLFSGAVSVNTAPDGAPESIGTVSYNPDGKGLKFDGAFEVDAAALTGGYVTGRFKMDKSAKGTGLWATDLNFAKGPLAGKLEAFSGGFDTAKRSFAIDVTITPAALKQVLPSWITAKSAIKIKAAKDGDKGKLTVDVQGDATFAIEFGEYFTGSISIKKVQEAIAADLTIDKVKFDAGDFKFGGAGKMSFDSTKSPKVSVDANSHLDVTNDALGLKGSLTAMTDAEGNVNGAKIAGTLGETGITTEAKFSGSYQTGKNYDISGEATFKSVDGLLDPGAKLALGYGSESGFKATAENLKFNAGALKGLTVVKAWFTSKGADKGWGINVKGGVDIDLSDDIKAHVDDSSNFTAKGTGNGAPSFSGVVKGTVKVGDLANIKLKFTGAGNDIAIHADNQEGTEIGKLTEDIVTGLAKFQYDGSMKKLKGGKFRFQLESPTVNVSKISGSSEDGAPTVVPPALGSIIQSIHGEHDEAGWTGNVTIRDTKMDVMGAPIHVHNSKVVYGKDKKLDGAIKADGGGGEGSSVEAKVEVGWKKGKFYFKGGVDFDVKEITEYAEGRVHAEGDSSTGDAQLRALGTITTKGPIEGVKIDKLRGSKKAKKFKFSAKVADFLQRALGGALPDSIQLGIDKDSSVDVDYKPGKLSVVGGIKGSVSFKPGSEVVASGNFDLGFDNTKVHAKATDVEFKLKEYLKGKLDVDFATGIEKGSIEFNVPGIAHGKVDNLVVKPKDKQYSFDTKVHFDDKLQGLNKVELEAKLANGVLTAKADLSKDIDFEVASSKLTIAAGSKAEVNTQTKSFSADLHGAAVLPSQLGKGTWHASYDGGLKGGAHFDVEPVAIFAATSVDVDFEGGKLHTKKPVVLNVDNSFGQYFPKTPNITLSYTDQGLDVHGHIDGPLKGLGVIGDAFQGGNVSFNAKEKKVHADGTFSMAKLKGMSKSTLNLGIDGTKFFIKGDIVADDIDGVTFTQNKLALEWTKGTPFKISGGFAGTVKELADFDVKVSAGDKTSPGGGSADMPEDKPKFTATGKLTATGVKKYLPAGVEITDPSAVLFVSMDETGKWDFGVQDLGCRILAIPGVDKIDAGFNASFTKKKGLSVHADVKTCKIKNFDLDGFVDIEETKFKGGQLHASADFPGVGLDGTVIVKPATDFGLNFNTKFTVTPKGDSGFAKFVKDGSLEIDYAQHQLQKVEGIINLKPPDFLKDLKNPQIKVTYQAGEISAEATCGFANPFGADQPDGWIKVSWSSSAGFSAEVHLPVTLPGMKQSEIYGKIDASGNIELGANFFPDGALGEFLEQAHIDLKYTGGQFIVSGWIILTPGKDFKLKIGVQYNFSTGQFDILGLDQHEKPKEDDTINPVAGISEEIDVPLASVGVAELDLEIGFGVSLGYKKPKFQFDKPEIVGGLDALKGGKMPAVKFGGKIGVGAAVTFEISLGIAGKIQLLIASAKMGVKGVLKAILELNLGADIHGQFEQGKGADISIDPSVSAALKLRAELHAFLKAKVCFFTVVDKDWELGGVDLANIPLGSFHPFEPIDFNIGGPDAGFKNGSPKFKNDKDKIIDGVKSGSQQIGDDAANEDSKKKIHTVLGPIRAAAAQWETLPPNWKDGMTTAPVEFNSFFPGVPDDAWDFYRDHADHAEEMDPADACRSPAEKFAKTVAVYSRLSPALAGNLVLGWRRAQVAHAGINPDTGVDVVAEREEVQALIDKKYQEDLAAAQAAQAAQDAEHAKKVEKQGQDHAKAEHEHQKKIAETKKQYDDKVHAHEKEAKLATAKAEQAEKDAEKEGAKEKAKPEEKGPPPAPPPPPPNPVPLAKPAPIPVPPPVPLPPPPQVLPAVTMPALPDNGFAPPASKPIPKVEEKPAVAKPSVSPTPPTSAPAGTPGVSSAADKGGGGGGSAGGGFKAPGGGGGGKGGGAPPGPQVEAGAAGIISQAKTLDAKKAELTGGKGAGKAAPGAAPPPPPPAGAAAAAPAGAPGKDQKGAATGKDGKKSDAKSADASVDPTVQAVVDKGKGDEQKQAQEAKQKEDAYHKQTDDKKTKAGAAEAKLNEVAKKQHDKNEKSGGKGGERKMPALGDFPPPSADVCKTAFSNWTKLKLKGDSFTTFSQKMKAGSYFNFETKSWGALLDDYKKVFDAAKPEDVLPDPKDWAAKLFAGSSWAGGGQYKAASIFDPGYSLSDDAIKAYETFDKFKTTNAGHKPGQYLIAEVEKMADTEKATFVNGKLAPLASAAEVVKALRVALDKLGPAAQVQARAAEIDGGKIVKASDFWTQMVASFNQAVAGIAQINDVLAKVQAHDPKAAEKDKDKGADAGKDAKGADAGKAPDAKAADAGKDKEKDKDKDKKADAKPEAQKAADATKGAPPAGDTAPAGAKPTPPEMVGWDKVSAQFEAAAKGRIASLTKLFALDPSAGLDANEAATLAKRTESLQRMIKANEPLPPEKVYEIWAGHAAKDNIAQLMKEASALATDFAAKLTAARKAVPRLNADGVRKAVELLHRTTGSSTKPALTGVDLNPAEVTPEEKVDLALLTNPVDGADWNPFWDATFCTKIYAPEKFNPAVLQGVKTEEKKDKDKDKDKDEKKDASAAAKPGDPKAPDAGAKAPDAGAKTADAGAKPADAGAKPADAGAKTPDAGGKPAEAKTPDPGAKPAEAKAPDAGAKPADAAATKAPEVKDPAKDPAAAAAPKPADAAKPGAVDPDALKAAEAKLKVVFHGLATPPTKLATMSEQERVELAAKPDADVRKQFFADFDSLAPSMNALQKDKVQQLADDAGFEEGTKDAAIETFKKAAHLSFVTKGEELSSTFTSTVRANKLTFLGKKLTEKDLDAAVPDDKGLSRVIHSKSVGDAIDVAQVKPLWQARKENEGKKLPNTEGLQAWAMINLVKPDIAGAIKSGLVDGGALVKWPGWVFPEPDIKADALFSEYCDLLALYANWYPQGHIRLTVKRSAVVTKVKSGNLRKPTVFDGMQSPLWVQRDNRDHNWGKTGGGLREALLKIDIGDVDESKWHVVEIDPKYQTVLDAQNKEDAHKTDPANNPAPTAKDKATVADHEKAQLGAAQATQAAQAKEDNAAKAGGAPSAAAAGAAGKDAAVDAETEKDAAPPVTTPFDMAGEPHTLIADPAKDSVEFHSLNPLPLVKKILVGLGLVPPDAAGDLGAAAEQGKKAEEAAKSADLKAGAKKPDRIKAARLLKTLLEAISAVLAKFGIKTKWTDVSKPAAEQAAKQKAEQSGKKDGATLPGDNANEKKPGDASAAASAPAKDGAKAEAKGEDTANAKDVTPASGGASKPADGASKPADGASKPVDATTSAAKPEGAAKPEASPKPAKPDGGAIHVEPKQVALKKPATLGFDGKQVTVTPPGGSVVDAIKILMTAVDHKKHKALNAAIAAAEQAAARVAPNAAEPPDAATTNPRLAADLDAVAKALESAGIGGMQLADQQDKPPALKTPADAEEAFHKHRSWAELKRIYWSDDPKECDAASMWQLFHWRKAWVDQNLQEICDQNQCTKKDFGSGNATSDYDLSIKRDTDKPLPDALKAKRPTASAAPAATQPATGAPPSAGGGGEGPPEKQQLEAAVAKAAQAAAKKNASLEPAPAPVGEQHGVNKVITAFNAKVASAFGAQPGVVFDTNLYDAGETAPAASDEAPKLQSDEAKEADVFVQDVAAMTKVRRYLADENEKPPKYRSKTYDDYTDKLVAQAGTTVGAKVGQVLAEAQQVYEMYKGAFDEQLAEIQKGDAGKPVGVTDKNKQPLDPELLKQDQAMRASNKLYAERVAVVDALRQRRQEIIDKVDKYPTPEQKAQIDELTNQIRAQSVVALQFAGEGYNSEGAMVDVVINQQKLKSEGKSPLITTLNEKLQSMNEQFGDVFKEFGHVEGHGGDDKAGVAAVAAAKASKYAFRFARVANEAIEALPDDAKPKGSIEDVKKLLSLNAEGGPLQSLRQAPNAEKAKKVLEAAGVVPEQYKGMFMPVNIALNSAIRGAIEAENAKGGGKDGGGGAGGKPV